MDQTQDNLSAYVNDLKKLAKENNNKRVRKKLDRSNEGTEEFASAVQQLKDKRKGKQHQDDLHKLQEQEALELRDDELNAA